MSEYEVTHMCPPKRSGTMPCCGFPPFERRSDRMTLDPELVTCGADFAAADTELTAGKTRPLTDWLDSEQAIVTCEIDGCDRPARFRLIRHDDVERLVCPACRDELMGYYLWTYAGTIT